MFDSIRKQIANIISPNRNSMSLPQQFLRYGNTKGMVQDWSQTIMSDEDFYTGYSYAAIRNRANSTARIATSDYLITDGVPHGEVHPYLEVIERSKTFTNYEFWKTISTYLDLEGVFYLMAVRTVGEESVGDVQYFRLLNPYNVQRVLSQDGLEVAGYVENRKGRIREIPRELIIPIVELNPFDSDKAFGMTDAAKSSQFTLSTANDYTRHALKNNINAPGILTTDVILGEEEFANFVSRVKNRTKGEPLFGNGQGAIKYENMQTELDKAALKDVNEIQRDTLFAVSGVSKTMMGIEQSGTTRDTARTQKDLYIENQILPQIQVIIDALNQDYTNNYVKDGTSDYPYLTVASPLSVDHESEMKAAETKKKEYEMYNTLVNAGYDRDVAASYVKGAIDLEELGEPINEPVTPIMPQVNAKDDEKDNADDDIEADNHLRPAINQLNNSQKGLLQQSQASLQNAIVNTDAQLFASAINRIKKTYKKPVKNQIDAEGDVITKTEKKEALNELVGILAAFYGVVLTLEGPNVINRRNKEFATLASFVATKKLLDQNKKLAQKVAEGHINTIANDVYSVAREQAARGATQEDIIDNLTKKFSKDVSETRAKTVARTETNRAFTITQYEADKQFIEQNKLQGRVYKKWITRSDNPCGFCSALEAEGAVPFENAFRELGDSVKVGDKELAVDFVELHAGNAHPNCSCTYELIIKPAKNAMGEI